MTRESGQRPAIRRWPAVAALGAALLAVLVAVLVATIQGEPARAAGKATVTVNTSGKPTGQIGDHFMGLSFESSTLNNGYRYDAVGNLTQLLKNLGPGVIRFGGNTADTVYTQPNQQQYDALSRLTKATGWSVLYSEDLVHFNASQVAAHAKQVGEHRRRRPPVRICLRQRAGPVRRQPPPAVQLQQQPVPERGELVLQGGPDRVQGRPARRARHLLDDAVAVGLRRQGRRHRQNAGRALLPARLPEGEPPAVHGRRHPAVGLAGRLGGQPVHRLPERREGRQGAAADHRDQQRLPRRRNRREQRLRLGPVGRRLPAHRRPARRRRDELPRRAQHPLQRVHGAVLDRHQHLPAAADLLRDAAHPAARHRQVPAGDGDHVAHVGPHRGLRPQAGQRRARSR